MFLKNKKKFLENKDRVIRKKTTNKINTSYSYEALIKSDKYSYKLNKGASSNTIDFRILRSNEDIDELINVNNISYKINFKRKKFGKSIDKNNSIKKRKKLNDLDIISSNLEKTSLNLNQPEAFYAGLFNNIINKDYL